MLSCVQAKRWLSSRFPSSLISEAWTMCCLDRPICYPKPGLLQLRVLSSLATHLHSYQGRLALYLAIVIDLFSRAILGWKLSDSLHADLVVDATTRAIDSGFVPRGAIFHSDRGCQSRHHHPRVARPTWLGAHHHQANGTAPAGTVICSPDGPHYHQYLGVWGDPGCQVRPV